MLREAYINLAGLKTKLSFARLDAQELPFSEASFDVVVANHVLYHVTDRDRALSEIRRVLDSGGTLYAATNGRAHLCELDQIIKRFMPRRGIAEHVERFGLETGEPQLRRHFERVELRRYDDSLVVNEAQALVDYAASATRAVTAEALAAMRTHVEELLHSHSSIRISKDAGVLIAS